jgi:hypothetical protein
LAIFQNRRGDAVQANEIGALDVVGARRVEPDAGSVVSDVMTEESMAPTRAFRKRGMERADASRCRGTAGGDRRGPTRQPGRPPHHRRLTSLLCKAAAA